MPLFAVNDDWDLEIKFTWSDVPAVVLQSEPLNQQSPDDTDTERVKSSYGDRIFQLVAPHGRFVKLTGTVS